MHIHKEYALTVVKTIYEDLGGIRATYAKPGDTLTLSKEQYNDLQDGKAVEFHVVAGMGEYAKVEYTKHNFANAVEVLEIHTERYITKLGVRAAAKKTTQSKSKSKA
jgi:hypothetical protein